MQIDQDCQLRIHVRALHPYKCLKKVPQPEEYMAKIQDVIRTFEDREDKRRKMFFVHRYPENKPVPVQTAQGEVQAAKTEERVRESKPRKCKEDTACGASARDLKRGGEWRSCSVATNTVMLRGVPFAFSWRSGLRSVRVSHLDVVVHGDFERRRPDAYGGPACAVQNAGEAALSLEDRVLLVSALRIRLLPLPLSFSLVPLFLLALTLTCAAAPPPPSGARRLEVRGRPRAAEKGASTGPSGESDAGFPRAGDGGCTVNGDVTISRGPGQYLLGEPRGTSGSSDSGAGLGLSGEGLLLTGSHKQRSPLRTLTSSLQVLSLLLRKHGARIAIVLEHLWIRCCVNEKPSQTRASRSRVRRHEAQAHSPAGGGASGGRKRGGGGASDSVGGGQGTRSSTNDAKTSASRCGSQRKGLLASMATISTATSIASSFPARLALPFIHPRRGERLSKHGATVVPLAFLHLSADKSTGICSHRFSPRRVSARTGS
ncbi:hypothetical protein B0H14DRAFT_3687896 [Mycena olivaceomarginata]|nr:hypothetical protein B0H14DRAFT_3687896 [Mycena olivaceomarginata]